MKPEYPAAGRSVRIRGSVQVTVLIDPRGCVNTATAISGHPLLRSGSVKAAARSSFYPIQVGGQAIWINGVIVYNYVLDTANWLEIGYSSTSRDELIEYLPAGFDSVRKDLRAIDGSYPYEQHAKAMETVVEKIRFALRDRTKDLWLFDVGSILNAMTNSRWIGPDGLEDLKTRLSTLIKSAPTSIEPALVPSLAEMLDEQTSSDFWNQLRELRNRFYYLGN